MLLNAKISSNEYNNNLPLLSNVLSENDTNHKANNIINDSKNRLTQNDFLKISEETNKNFGFLDEVIPLMYKNNKSIYYMKIIDKKSITPNNSYQNIISLIYTINNDKQKNKNNDYMINLQTYWEDNEKLFLVFDGIKRYSLLEKFLKNKSENITEENIIIIFRQILEAALLLQEYNIFGCNYNINSFIYDNKLQNGCEFDEYFPPEFFTKINSNLYELDKIKNASFDIWELGILFYKIATFGESPYDGVKNENLKESIINNNINYSKLDKYSPQIMQIIDKMLQFEPTERYNIDRLLNLEPFKMGGKIPQLIINAKKRK